ncbi:MAG TPA: hypothetical protein PLL90_04065 [Bacteroidales bacterium]|nr:hypothetical protein [Bacteroidales bacterium]
MKKKIPFYLFIVSFAIACNQSNALMGTWEITDVTVDTNLIPEKMDLQTASGLFVLNEISKPSNIIISKDSILLCSNSDRISDKISKISNTEKNKYLIDFDKKSGVFEIQENNLAKFTVDAMTYFLKKGK